MIGHKLSQEQPRAGNGVCASDPFSRNSEVNAVKCCGISFGGARRAVPTGILGEKPLLPAEPFLPTPRSTRRLSGTERLVPFLQAYLNLEPSSLDFFDATSKFANKQEESLGSGQGLCLAPCLMGCQR